MRPFNGATASNTSSRTTAPHPCLTCGVRRPGPCGFVRCIDTSPDPVYDLTDAGQRWSLYSAIVRDGLASEQAALLNRTMLVELWADLNLPTRCRAIWEARFPELAEASRAKAS